MLEEGCTQNVWAPRTIYGKLINSRTFTGICGDLVGLCVSRTMYVSKIGSCRMENAPRHVHLRRAGWSNADYGNCFLRRNRNCNCNRNRNHRYQQGVNS